MELEKETEILKISKSMKGLYELDEIEKKIKELIAEDEYEEFNSDTNTIVKTDWIESLSLHDIIEIENMTFEILEEYLNNEIKQMSCPYFHDILNNDIMLIMEEQLLELGIYNKSNYEELENYIHNLCDHFFMTISNIPPRSYNSSVIVHSITESEIPKIEFKINKLRNTKQPKQKSEEWYKTRNNMLTASNIWKIFASEAQFNSLVYEKCSVVNTNTNESYSQHQQNINVYSTLHWGNKYEPLSVMIYEKSFNTNVEDFGCIVHSEYPFIGASPDGIITDPKSERFGRMIEVKNIYNRVINGIPKQEYWIQMQIQMETCDLDECDFIETRFKEYENEESFYKNIISTTEIEEQPQPPEYKGVILYFMEKPFPKTIDKIIQRVDKIERMFSNTNDLIKEPEKDNITVMTEPGSHYVYMEPIHKDKQISKKEIDEWIKSKTKELSSKYYLYETSYWYLDTFSCVLVKRNREWFQTVLPKFQEFWNIIEKERVHGYEHRLSSRLKQKKEKQLIIKQENACKEKIIFDDSIHNITVPKNNNYLIVKLEH